MPNILKDMTGHQVGTLTVVARVPESKHEARWLCRCECGREKTFTGSKIRRGEALCICSGGHSMHGLHNHPLYKVWSDMRRRCANTSDPNYGGRGISVCDEWVEFSAFYEWAMQSGWRRGLEIDRRDNDGNYEPTNCRFVTAKINNRNKRSNFPITFNGETKLLVEWSEQLGIPMKVLHNRIRTYGWATDRALSTPHMTIKEAAQHRFSRRAIA